MFVFLVFHRELLFLRVLLGLALALCRRLRGQTGQSVRDKMTEDYDYVTVLNEDFCLLHKPISPAQVSPH